MKCPTCESCEYAQYCGATEIMRKCERHNKKVEQTNDEWRRTCSTEEFAEFLFEKACYCSMCGDESQDTEEKIKSCPFGKTACVKKDWEKWLKEIHDEDD